MGFSWQSNVSAFQYGGWVGHSFSSKEQASFNFMAAVILEPPKITSDTVSTVSPFICHEVMGPDAMIFVFWMLGFKPIFSLSSFTLFYFIFKLYNIVLVLPNIEMNPPQVYMCSPSWTLLPLPPHTIPLGRPSAPAPSTQYRTSNLDWQLVSYMIFYMFQCHSPKSSHPLPLPQSPKDYSIHQCLFCCLVHRVIVTIFLNSIYMH